MTLLLFVSCFITPLQLCDLVKLQALTTSIDCLFAVDMIVIFQSAVLDDEFETIDDRSQIAFHYITTWFFIDLISIIPFELMIKVDADSNSSSQVAQVNQMLRILRIGKLTKLFKLIRLLRVLKMMKTQEKVYTFSRDVMQFGFAGDRLLLFILISIFIVHLFGCLWLFAAGFILESN